MKDVLPGMRMQFRNALVIGNVPCELAMGAIIAKDRKDDIVKYVPGRQLFLLLTRSDGSVHIPIMKYRLDLSLEILD